MAAVFKSQSVFSSTYQQSSTFTTMQQSSQQSVFSSKTHAEKYMISLHWQQHVYTIILQCSIYISQQYHNIIQPMIGIIIPLIGIISQYHLTTISFSERMQSSHTSITRECSLHAVFSSHSNSTQQNIGSNAGSSHSGSVFFRQSLIHSPRRNHYISLQPSFQLPRKQLFSTQQQSLRKLGLAQKRGNVSPAHYLHV